MLIGLALNIIGTVILMMTNDIPADAVPYIIGRVVGGLAISGPIAVVYLMGGSAMIRRTSLGAAKTAAIVGCIPCFNCVILTPIGIWAAILVFSDAARRDFSD